MINIDETTRLVVEHHAGTSVVLDADIRGAACGPRGVQSRVQRFLASAISLATIVLPSGVFVAIALEATFAAPAIVLASDGGREQNGQDKAA